MSVQKVTIHDLSDPVRNFFEQLAGRGLLVEDETGRACFGVVPYHRATAEQRIGAAADLAELQKQVGDQMRADGRRESELDSLLADEPGDGV